MAGYSHFDDFGRPLMVDVSGKKHTRRKAAAECFVKLPEKVCDALKNRGVSKGDPMRVAELSGIMGAKKTSDLIPLCHSVSLDSVRVVCEFREHERTLRIECEASADDATGVEMEALTGVSVAALAFYDMCKALDKGMVITGVRLLEKSGGRSGVWRVLKSDLGTDVEHDRGDRM
ncbi:MAG: cyclic pyranopterin monophosphate synthase MoaC [Synergistaceae bacterium]|jgi:cyclic pyranopterin phosphate synthase|nr:cyclic pyranopterin monophosphate synthase MoaC [Synergistaceae bacterium]